MNLPLDIPLIPEGMTDTFLPEGDDKVELLLDIASTLPMAMDLKIEFTDASGAVVTAFDTISIAKAGEGEEFGAQERLDITDVIGRISDIEGMNVTLLRPDLEKVNSCSTTISKSESGLRKRAVSSCRFKNPILP